MKNNYFKPYGMNIEYELKTYKYVGRDYGELKTANRGWFSNFTRFLRKKVNKKQNRYCACNTYSEWKLHVKGILKKEILNYNDFLHWLYQQKRNAEIFLDSVKTILIPLYVAMISVSNLFPEGEAGETSILIAIFIVALFSAIYLSKAEEKVQFYNDFIEIAEEEI